jgi:phosphopantothenate---cysteine ligase (CTP)
MTPRTPHIVITAGGTREPLDDVRHVSNIATGTLPAAVANALLQSGCSVDYVHGPGAILPATVTAQIDVTCDPTEQLAAIVRQAEALHIAVATKHLSLHPITTSAQANSVLEDAVRQSKPDAVLCAMAVADYAPIPATGKVSSQLEKLLVEMIPTAKTIDRVKVAHASTTLFGFKLLSGASWDERAAACALLGERASADYIVCNDMVDYRRGVRRAWLYDGSGRRLQDLGDATTTAEQLAREIADAVVTLITPRKPA